MLALRRPAPSYYIDRRRRLLKRRAPLPGEGSRRFLVETCRAELEWAEAEWRHLGGAWVDVPFTLPAGLPHPSEALRLPHEVAAARVVNCHLHVDVETWRLRELLRRLPGQRRASRDPTQSEAYRASWADVAAGTLTDLRDYRRRRAMAWRAFLDAATRYRLLRAQLDRPQEAAA
jgi:hypothetical protein